MALIENIQRADLNPIEEAQAYQLLLTKLRLTQETLAKSVGKNRATITNALRLLALPESVQQYLIDGRLSAGHARAILSLKKKNVMENVAKTAVAKGLSVRALEKLTAQYNEDEKREQTQRDAPRDPDLRRLEARLEERLGCKVVVRPGRKNGRIEITYYDLDDLDRILDIICKD